MLILLAYDIASPKRLAVVAKTCKDYGVRVQKSIFECRIKAEQFETFWNTLSALVNPDKDCLVAYQISADDVAKTRVCGKMSCSEPVVCYSF
jgi:CRISPR-associated protein Cas2